MKAAQEQGLEFCQTVSESVLRCSIIWHRVVRQKSFCARAVRGLTDKEKSERFFAKLTHYTRGETRLSTAGGNAMHSCKCRRTNNSRHSIMYLWTYPKKELLSSQEMVAEETREEAQKVYSEPTQLQVKLRKNRGEGHGKSDVPRAWSRARDHWLRAAKIFYEGCKDRGNRGEWFREEMIKVLTLYILRPFVDFLLTTYRLLADILFVCHLLTSQCQC